MLKSKTTILNRKSMELRETRAIRTIHTIRTAQAQYMSQFGRFAKTLAELGSPAAGQTGVSPAAADLIPGDLALGEEGGYRCLLRPTADGGYTMNASPIIYNTTGRRTFYSDQSLDIRANDGPELSTIYSPKVRD